MLRALRSGIAKFPKREISARGATWALWLAMAAMLGFLSDSRVEAAATVDPFLSSLLDSQSPFVRATDDAVTDDGMVNVLAEGSPNFASFGPLGVQAGTHVGDITTLRVPKANLAAFLALPGLRNVRLARTLTPMLDASIPATHADLLWQEAAPSQGEGVLIGIVDSGIDVNHADFRNPLTGKTRIVELWDQTVGTTNPPPNFTYGRRWMATEIDAGQCTETDMDGHGTFLAGIAAGNGQATGNGQPAYKYVGVAPKSDIVVVKSRGLDTNLIDGINYVFQTATRRGQDAVVCIAYGTEDGAHDGTDPMEASINALSGPGRIVCAAAGNYGDKPIHAETTISTAHTGSVTFNVPVHTAAGNQWVYIAGWYEASTTASVSVITPKGKVIGPLTRGQTYYQDSGEGFVNFMNGVTTNSQGDPRILLSVANGTEVTPGVWTIQLNSNNTGATVDFWLYSSGLNGLQASMQGSTTTAKTVVIPATADSVISAGAYSTKTSWVAQNGSTYFLVGAVAGTVAPWSSQGPSRDGRQIPDVCAPGYGVGSTKSAAASVSATRLLQDGVHFINYGTSAAAAHVTGSVALELQRNPGMSVNAVRSFLRDHALADANTGATYNSTWGFGKLCLKNCNDLSVGVDDLNPRSLGFAAPYPNPSSSGLTIELSISPSDLKPSDKVSFRIVDVHGRLVRALPVEAKSGPQRLVWDGFGTTGQRVPAGLYFGRFEVGGRLSVRKFVMVQGT